MFEDKLVNHEDKGWLERQLFDLMRESFTPDLIRQVSVQGMRWTVLGNYPNPNPKPCTAELTALLSCVLCMHLELSTPCSTLGAKITHCFCPLFHNGQ